MKINVISFPEDMLCSENYRRSNEELKQHLDSEVVTDISIDRRKNERLIIRFESGDELIVEGSEGYLIIDYKGIEY